MLKKAASLETLHPTHCPSDRKNVELTTVRWKDTVTLGTSDAPKKTAGLYASDGILWGTVSEEVRDTPQEIYDYFVSRIAVCTKVIGRGREAAVLRVDGLCIDIWQKQTRHPRDSKCLIAPKFCII